MSERITRLEILSERILEAIDRQTAAIAQNRRVAEAQAETARAQAETAKVQAANIAQLTRLVELLLKRG